MPSPVLRPWQRSAPCFPMKLRRQHQSQHRSRRQLRDHFHFWANNFFVCYSSFRLVRSFSALQIYAWHCCVYRSLLMIRSSGTHLGDFVTNSGHCCPFGLTNTLIDPNSSSQTYDRHTISRREHPTRFAAIEGVVPTLCYSPG